MYRSGFERNIVKDLKKRKVPFAYECNGFTFHRRCTYYPDFKIDGFYVEAKGRFTSSDRSKHLLVKAENPKLDIRFLFMNASNKLYKGSKTTYGEWATKHGYQWAEGTSIPKEWLV